MKVKSQLLGFKNRLRKKVKLHGFEEVLNSKIFKKNYYEEQSGIMFKTTGDAITHYLKSGWKNLYNPHPLFDTEYYIQMNEDIKEANINPLVHFINHGFKEFRNPSPFFSIKKYYKEDKNLLKNKINALSHYIEFSNKYPNHNPNSLFINKYYLDKYNDIAKSGMPPLAHYIEHGIKENRKYSKWQTKFFNSTHKSDFNLTRGNWSYGKILLISHEASRTGAPLIILKIAEELSQKYHFDVHTILVKGGEIKKDFVKTSKSVYDISQTFKIHQLDQEGINLLIKGILDEVNPLFTIVNSAASNTICEALYQNKHKFFCLTHEFADPFHPDKFKSVLQAEQLIVPSQIVKESIEKKYDSEFSNLIVRGQGVLGSNFGQGNKELARAKIFQELSLEEDTVLVISSGYVHGRKGIDAYYHIANDVIRQSSSKVCFCWVGHYDNNSFDDIEYWITYDLKKMENFEKIKFIGQKENIEDYFLAADVFLMASRMDPFPCVVLEAMACSLPVVCFENAIGSSEIISGGSYTIFPYMDLRAISDGINFLINNSNIRKEIGQENAEIVAENYQYEDYVSDLLKIISADTEYDFSKFNSIELNENKKPKVIALCSDWGLSGVNSALEALGLELIEKGINFEILFTQHPHAVRKSAWISEGKYAETKLPHTFLPQPIKNTKHWWHEIISFYERNSPCIMLTTYDFSGTCVVPALSNNVGVISWVQSDDPDYYEQTNRLGRYFNKIAVVSDFLEQSIGNLNPLFKDRIFKVYNSTIKLSEIVSPRVDIKTASHLRLIYTGRLVQYQKRVLDFIPLVQELKKQNIPFVLTLAGQDTTGGKIEGRLKKELSAEIESGIVRLTGRLTRIELFSELKNHDIFILLSDFEGLPLSLGEAMGQGCVPVVAKMDSGISELVTNNENGLIVESRDYAYWASELKRLHEDRLKVFEFSNNTLERVKANITVESSAEKFVKEIYDIHESLINMTYERPITIKAHNKTGDILISQYMQKEI